MILYLDTSALLKRYFREHFSDAIIACWKSASHLVTSSVAYAETMASMYRKQREANLKASLIEHVAALFTDDWQAFIRVEVNDNLNELVSGLVARHPLRGFDTIHLASALAIHKRISRDFVFACFDKSLLAAARAEGLETFPTVDNE
jgi:predicted nucleic acid-binding protein